MGAASSKQVFSGIVLRLNAEDINPSDHEFWDELWKSALSVEDIFEIVTADDVRSLIRHRPNNIKTMFTQAVAQLYQVVETPYPVYFDQALNCARILSRLLPILIENTSTNRTIKEMLWSRRKVKLPSKSGEEGGEAKDEEVQESEPLAVILVNTIFHLLFLPDFTIEDPDVEFREEDINTMAFKAALMWAPGVGSLEKSVTGSTQFDKNRIDVLRLMLACFCDSLFQAPDSYNSCKSYWLEVATSVDSPYAEIVCYSLLNTILGYDPIGWGMPYSNLVSTDTAKLVMESSVQALVVLLDYGHPVTPSTEGTGMGVEQGDGINVSVSNKQSLPCVRPDDTEAKGFNVFRRILSNIEDPDQLNFIFQGFVRLFNNAHQAASTYLPYSITRVGIEQELLVLLWKCLDEIPKLVPYILKHCDVTQLLVPTCYFLLEGRKDPSKVGLIYLCTFTLLKLSGERNFGVSLNKPYKLTLPVDVPLFSGTHNDLLVITLHKLIVSGIDKLSALYNCFLTIICNVSPYCKSLGTVASVKLVNLFQLFAAPKFLFAAEGNYMYLSMLLECFNNMIQYQYEGNGSLVYALLRRKETFESLATLTLESALSKITASRTAKQMLKAIKSPGKDKGTSSIGMEDSSLHGQSSHYSRVKPTELISTKDVTRSNGDPNSLHNKEALVAARAPQIVQSSMGDGKFIPTETWIQLLKTELPLQTVMRLSKHLVPQVEELVAREQMDEGQVVAFLKQTTMVGLLPVPHPIVIRKYQANKFTCLWFTAFQWGVIFMNNQALPLFDGRFIKLFTVQTAEST